MQRLDLPGVCGESQHLRRLDDGHVEHVPAFTLREDGRLRRRLADRRERRRGERENRVASGDDLGEVEPASRRIVAAVLAEPAQVAALQKRVEQRNYMIRKRSLDFDDVMNNQREVVYTYRNEVIDSEDPHKLVYEVIDEAVPAKVREYLGTGAPTEEPNHPGLLHWVNTTFPLGLTKERAQFETRTPDENGQFLIEKIKEAYQRKSSHEEPTAVKSLERYIILNAIDRLWQEHLYAMDALREGVYLRGYAQKDPLIEYKTEAYEMFVDLMANIKNEVLNNLFRSTSNLQAFEKFLSTLPQFLMREQAPPGAGPTPGRRPERIGPAVSDNGDSNGEAEVKLELSPIRREMPKVGRNEPCPCGSGKKYKNCCGRLA